tara:strand:+ start:903 stop:1244 length:342 start_codon:yes stop_codon:yes gene_type:complete
MCAPAVIPILGAIGGVATAAQQLGLIGRRNQQTAPTFKPTAAPQIKSAGPAAQGAGDDEKTKKVDESIKIQQNAKQKRDKQTTKKGLGALGAAAAVNTGVSETNPAGGVNTGT